MEGYAHALTRFKIADNRFSQEFSEWVARRLNVKIAKSWANIIQFHTASDREAMDLFWRLLDKFEATKTEH